MASIEQDFRGSVCAAVSLTPVSSGEYLVHVPFTLEDGDHYVVVLKHHGGRWALTDEGHMLMHLSYSIRNEGFERGNRREIIDRVLKASSRLAFQVLQTGSPPPRKTKAYQRLHG